MKLRLTIVQDESGVYVAECPVIPGCVSQGRTEGEAEANIREAIEACLAVRAEQGLPPPQTLTAAEWKQEFHTWLETHDAARTPLPPEALERTSFYGERG